MDALTGGVIAGTVVLVGGLLLFAHKGRVLREAEQAERARTVLKTVSDWGRFVETVAPDPLTIYDVSELPHPKKQIEEACLVAIVAANGNPNYQNAVAVTLLNLSNFQEGVGAPLHQPIAAILEDAIKNSGKDMAGWCDEDHDRLINRLAGISDDETRYSILWRTVEADSERLLRLSRALV